MSKFKGLAGMDSVAINNKNNIDVATNISSNEEIDNDIKFSFENKSVAPNSIEGIINEIANREKANTKKRQIAIYLDEDIAKAFDKYAKKNGKGAKSELIEKLLQSTLQKAGYLKG